MVKLNVLIAIFGLIALAHLFAAALLKKSENKRAAVSCSFMYLGVTVISMISGILVQLQGGVV